MHLVILESPFAGNVEANTNYARACLKDSLSRGEAPIASHLLYTQEGVLNDDIPHERQWGIDAGLAWRVRADKSVVYIDRGISGGMQYGIKAAKDAGVPVEYRSIEGKEIPEELLEKKKQPYYISFEHVDDDHIRAIILQEDENGCKSVYDIVQFSLDAQLAPIVRLISKFLYMHTSEEEVCVRYSARWEADISRLRSVDSCLRRIIRSHPGKNGDFSKQIRLN
jgi:hypothetical protein